MNQKQVRCAHLIALTFGIKIKVTSEGGEYENKKSVLFTAPATAKDETAPVCQLNVRIRKK